jgi:hypothetical protein
VPIPTAPNPYEPAGAAASQTTSALGFMRRVPAVYWWCVLWFPLVPFMLVGATWFAAWAQLGHRPRPHLDDPSSISILVTALSRLSLLAITAFPALCFAGFVAAVCIPRRVRSATHWKATLSAGLYLIASLGIFLWVRKDTWQVLEWIFD